MLLYLEICDNVRRTTHVAAAIVVSALGVATSVAGSEPSSDSNLKLESRGSTLEGPLVRESRGLITVEGPSGMFINPTSATLPEGALILNYCVFVPTLPEGVGAVWHGILVSYGIRDWLEIGVIGNLAVVSLDGPPEQVDSFFFGGPMVRIRLLRDQNWWPELSVGAYFREGTPANVSNGENAFLAASKTLPVSQTGLIRSVTLQGGFRSAWLHDEAPVSNITRVYGGAEVQLPFNLYAIGEITQKDDRVESRIPWAAGIQWRGKWFGCTIAAVQVDGEDGPGFYFGVGGGLGAEPVRSSPSATRP